jgi:hypothetical protein
MSVEQMVECLAGETEVPEEILPHCCFIHHMTLPGFEPGPPRWEASMLYFRQFSEVLYYELFVMFVSVSHVKNTNSTITGNSHSLFSRLLKKSVQNIIEFNSEIVLLY